MRNAALLLCLFVLLVLSLPGQVTRVPYFMDLDSSPGASPDGVFAPAFAPAFN